MRLVVAMLRCVEENILLPGGRSHFLSLIGHDIAQWKKIQTKAQAFIDEEKLGEVTTVGNQEGLFVSFTLFTLSSISFLTLFFASLNSRTPRPRPLISSGILRPPNNNKTITSMIMISCVPSTPNKLACIIISRLDIKDSNVFKTIQSESFINTSTKT